MLSTCLAVFHVDGSSAQTVESGCALYLNAKLTVNQQSALLPDSLFLYNFFSPLCIIILNMFIGRLWARTTHISVVIIMLKWYVLALFAYSRGQIDFYSYCSIVSQFAEVLVSVCTHFVFLRIWYICMRLRITRLCKLDRSILNFQHAHYAQMSLCCFRLNKFYDFVLTPYSYIWSKVCSLDSAALYLHNIPVRCGCWLTHRLQLCQCVVLVPVSVFSLVRNSNFNSARV